MLYIVTCCVLLVRNDEIEFRVLFVSHKNLISKEAVGEGPYRMLLRNPVKLHVSVSFVKVKG